MSGKEYNGPETNETYEDTETFETFDDLDEDDTFSDEPNDGQQSATSHDGNDDVEEEDEYQEKKAARVKKEEKKKARGQKNDDLDSLDIEKEEDSEDEEEDEKEKEEEDEDEEEEAKDDEKTPKETEEKKSKGKPTYVTVDGETFALDSNAEVSVQVDGKNTKIPLQELKNHYSGKVAWDKKFNEINLKEHNFKKQEQQFIAEKTRIAGVKQKIEEIIKDPERNPKEALKIFLDQTGVDSYDLMEKMFKADLTELSNVLNMEPAERKAYFLEKRNSHLLEQSKKRDEQRQAEERVNSYKAKADALRKSFGVSEAQYVDALEELKSYGAEEKDLSEKEIVEWAATKPHRETVGKLLSPYKDQLVGDAYGELSWRLANILRTGEESPDIIKKHLAEVYGVPTEVKQLSKKLNPLGRKSKTPQKVSSKKKGFESFEDIDDE